ncbi:MAG: ATP-dependent zinc metalloprotease FtsH [bacterium]|nr:ATP-dependent zinc metalloprotease FtsH [bacterium]
MKNIPYIIIILIIASAVWGLAGYQKNQEVKNVPISQISRDVKNHQVKEINVEGSRVIATLKNNKKEAAYKEEGAEIQIYGINPNDVTVNVKNPNSGGALMSFLYLGLPIILFVVLFYIMFRQARSGNTQAMSFGKSTARLFSGSKQVTFNDIAGLIEPKQELLEIVEFLKQPDKFHKLGAEIPKGVLLFGPAGVGKTLLAKAVAGEAGVPFYSLSASEFVEMFVGVGASRVRDLFQKAKRNAPCVIFIDELDAIGRQRGTGLGGSHDEREQTLNQILVEMDGFETDSRVIVLAATNRPDVLDPALLRPGRFDRKVVLDLPDVKEREAILIVHGRNKPLAKAVDLKKIAQATPGLSGADLKNIMNEAAILAAQSNEKEIRQSDLDSSIEKTVLGPERKSHVMNQEEKKIAAYHEAGHAVVGRFLPNTDPIHKVSVVSRGMALGYTWSLPTEDKRLYSKSKFEDEIAQLLGGRASEETFFKEITTGAQNDVKRATKIAREMVTIYGMSDVGPISLGDRDELVFLGRELGEHKNYSEQLSASVDRAIIKFMEDGELKAKDVISKHRVILENLAKHLVEKETIEGEELEKIFTNGGKGKTALKPTG